LLLLFYTVQLSVNREKKVSPGSIGVRIHVDLFPSVNDRGFRVNSINLLLNERFHN